MITLAKARTRNPRFAEADARIDASDKGQELAERSWYPNVNVGVTAVQRKDSNDGYEALLEVNIPLQWGLHRSQQQSAADAAATTRSRRLAAEREIENGLQEACLALNTARRIGLVLAENNLPQAQASFQASMKGYELSRNGMADVLASLDRLRRAQIDLLNALYEQQKHLAEIERLVGNRL
ncbi:MAG: TolC family protein [Alphaproteobacteria bacterium]|nr:TolC family protein [Alphaproteobacteria bacterium]